VNAVSLVLALAANIALLLNMARRLSFAIAQSVTIIGWLLSAFLLIALVAVANSHHFLLYPREQHALSQAFYYAIIAAALYCIISLLMVVTAFGAIRGHYEKEFRLTLSQRTLMLQTIAFMMYLLIGALIYSHIEGWKYLDAVYWADFTLLTIGIGDDFTPKTHLGRSLLLPYAIGGIVTVGLVIGSVRSLVLERGKHKLHARFTEKKREHALSTIDPDNRTIKVGWFKRYDFSQEGLTEAQRREQEFAIMRRIQSGADQQRKWLSLFVSATAAFALWLIGAVVFEQAESEQQWSYFVSLYFSYTSLLTIGYGDLQPESNSGKPFFVFWSLLAVPTLTILISNMGDTVVKAFEDFTIWAGSLTILPGENGARATLRASINKITRQRLFKADTFQMGQLMMPYSGENKREQEEVGTIEDHAMDQLASYIEDTEMADAEAAESHGDTLERDIHLYHFVLAKELRKLMRDVSASPPRQYNYREWAWYLKLMGQDENDESLHRKPPVKVRSRKPLGRDKTSLENLGGAAGEDGDLRWSWLGTRSPLLGNKSEAEWLLEKLSAVLERELLKLRNGEAKKAKPPISLADIKKEEKGAKDEENGGNGRSGSSGEETTTSADPHQIHDEKKGQ
jgi:potassium channel subfamily K